MCLFSGRWRAAGACCPIPWQPCLSPVGWWDSPRIAAVGSVCQSPVCFKGWTGLYLLTEPGDTHCCESPQAAPTPCLGPSEGLTPRSFGQDPTSLFKPCWVLHGQDTPVAPSAGQGLRRLWGGCHRLPSHSYKTLGMQIPLDAGVEVLSLSGGTWGADPCTPLLQR